MFLKILTFLVCLNFRLEQIFQSFVLQYIQYIVYKQFFSLTLSS